jgi:3-deoxy-D-manno-octulosonic-acid transferase
MFLYNLGIYTYFILLKIASLFHAKARLWVEGRQNWEEKLTQKVADWHTSNAFVVWFHCASLGEFEQARNLIESIKKTQPKSKILLTFFSPSGYEVRKNYAFADYVMYLPLDTKNNAKKFLQLLNPSLIFFVKYELWLNFIFEIEQKKVPLVLVSARLREESRFLSSPLRNLYKKAFLAFTYIFTQDEKTKNILLTFCQHQQLIVSSDTRYDRVFSNFLSFKPISEISDFKRNDFCIVCGSCWQQEEEMILEIFPLLPENVKIILAPHEIHSEKIDKYISQFPGFSIKFSEYHTHKVENPRILWIDNVGMLSQIYHYGEAALVGGGFHSAGLHNILEPAVFGAMVMFGPQHTKFPEASEMIENGGAFEVKNAAELKTFIEKISKNNTFREEIAAQNKAFIAVRKGATELILQHCQHLFP